MNKEKQKNNNLKMSKRIILLIIMMMCLFGLEASNVDTVRVNMNYRNKEIKDLSDFKFCIILEDTIKIDVESRQFFLLVPHGSLDKDCYETIECDIIVSINKKEYIMEVPYVWLKSKKWRISIDHYKGKRIKKYGRYSFIFGSYNLWVSGSELR